MIIVLSPYDLIVEGSNGKLYKVQCKYATIKDNKTISVYLYSTTRRANKSEDETVFIKKYYDDIDFMAVYCPNIDEVFIIPKSKFLGKQVMSLRIEEATNGQSLNVNYAKDFSIDKLNI